MMLIRLIVAMIRMALLVAGATAAVIGAVNPASAATGVAFSYPTSPGSDATFYQVLTTGSNAMTVWNFLQ